MRTLLKSILIASISLLLAAAPETKPVDEDPARAAMSAARKFIRAIGVSDDQVAYDLTSAEFRKQFTLEQFTETAKRMRIAETLDRTPPVEGRLLVKPKEGEPRVARLGLGPHDRIFKRGTPRLNPPETVVVALAEEKDGKWVVTEAKTLPIRGWKTAFFAPLPARPGDDSTINVSSHIYGIVTEASNEAVTIRLTARPLRGAATQPADVVDAAGKAKVRTLKVDKSTRVMLGYTTVGFPGQPGRTVPMEKKGAGGELKPGDRISANASVDDDDVAAKIMLLPASDKKEDAAPGL